MLDAAVAAAAAAAAAQRPSLKSMHSPAPSYKSTKNTIIKSRFYIHPLTSILHQQNQGLDFRVRLYSLPGFVCRSSSGPGPASGQNGCVGNGPTGACTKMRQSKYEFGLYIQWSMLHTSHACFFIKKLNGEILYVLGSSAESLPVGDVRIACLDALYLISDIIRVINGVKHEQFLSDDVIKRGNQN